MDMGVFLGRINKFSFFLLFLGFFLPFSHIYASEEDMETLSLEEAVSLALDYNLNLRKAQIDLNASGYSEKSLWMEIFFPTINANARASYSSTPVFGDPASGSFGSSYRIGAGISLGLNAGIPYAISNIRLAHQSNILRYEDARNQLEIQITKKYYSLVAEKNNLLLLEEVLNLAQRQYERNQISFRNGLIRELSVIQSSLAYENARYNLSAANTAYANSMAEFLAMLGMDSDSDISLSGEINIVKIEADAESLIEMFLPGRPDIARNIQEIERLQNSQRQTAMTNRGPTLSLSLDWSGNIDPFTDSVSGTATLNIPVDSWIPGTSRSQTIRGANDAVEKALLDLLIAQDSAKTQIRSLTARLHNSWDSIAIARMGLQAAQTNYNLTDQAFRNGTVEQLVLEDARNNMASARHRLLQSEFDYFNMILDLSSAINVNWKNLIRTFGVQSE
jgi:outer membrane protein TolC